MMYQFISTWKKPSKYFESQSNLKECAHTCPELDIIQITQSQNQNALQETAKPGLCQNRRGVYKISTPSHDSEVVRA